MTTEVICLASSKGGSGKTTITATLGTFLSKVGKRVLLIDCDEGTHGLTLMYLKEVNEFRKTANGEAAGIFERFHNLSLEGIKSSVVSVSTNLDLMPAKHSFSDARDDLKSGYFENLHMVVEYARQNYDYVFLDAQAGISDASRLAMSPQISDTVVLVSEYDPMSNAGVERMKAQLPSELDVSRTWVLLNKLLPEFVSKFSEFLTVARFLPPIPWTADVVRAYSRRRLALDFEGGNQFTLAILSILREVLSGENVDDLETWVNKQAERLREPISEQIQDSYELLKLLEKRNSPAVSLTRVYAQMIKSSLRLAGPILAGIGVLVSFETLQGGSSAFYELFRNAFPSISSSEQFALLLFALIFVAFVFGTGLNSLLSVQYEAVEERKQIRKRREEIEKRIKELKELESSNYEELVGRQE